MVTLTVERVINSIYQEPDNGIAFSVGNKEDINVYLSEIKKAKGLALAIMHAYENKMPIRFGKIPHDGRGRVKQISKLLENLESDIDKDIFVYFKNLKELHKLKEELNHASLKTIKY